MTTLQKIVAAAKKLKKQYPNKYSKWTDYIKAAAKTVKPVAIKSVKKVGAVKTKKKAAPAATKHTDKGSHNVKIKVVSGIGAIDLNQIGNELLSLEMKIKKLEANLKATKKLTEKKEIRTHISVLKKQFKALKLYLNTRARFIK
jgi:hypothetical protein